MGILKHRMRDFLGGPVVKNLPWNAADAAGSIRGQGTKIQHGSGQRNLHTTTSTRTHTHILLTSSYFAFLLLFVLGHWLLLCKLTFKNLVYILEWFFPALFLSHYFFCHIRMSCNSFSGHEPETILRLIQLTDCCYSGNPDSETLFLHPFVNTFYLHFWKLSTSICEYFLVLAVQLGWLPHFN